MSSFVLSFGKRRRRRSKSPAKRRSRSRSRSRSPRRKHSGCHPRKLHHGPQGGCYYVSRGRKVYVGKKYGYAGKGRKSVASKRSRSRSRSRGRRVNKRRSPPRHRSRFGAFTAGTPHSLLQMMAPCDKNSTCYSGAGYGRRTRRVRRSRSPVRRRSSYGYRW